MPLTFNSSAGQETATYYSSVGDLNGPGVSTVHRIVIQTNSGERYIGLSSNLSHEMATNLRIRIGTTTYAVLHAAQMVTGTIDA